VATATAPPIDEEPPPFDDDVPPETEPPFDPYESYSPPASAPASTSPTSASAGFAQQAPAQAQAQSQPQRQAPARAQSQAKAPAFGEKQRYGESVVREILGATFLEEQPYNPAQRERGQ
jgi:DNA polymerase-3 subunit gamma/tau